MDKDIMPGINEFSQARVYEEGWVIRVPVEEEEAPIDIFLLLELKLAN